MADSPAMQLARQMADSPAMRFAREMADSPAMRLARQMADSSAMQLARQAADNPATRHALEIANSSTMRLAREVMGNPLARAALEAANSPWVRAAREMPDNPLVRAAQMSAVDRIFTNERLGFGQILSGAPPHALLGSFVASQLAANARATNRLDVVLGNSFVLDAVATVDSAFETDEGTDLSFFDKFVNIVRQHLSSVHSVPELAGLMQMMMLILTVIAIYYAEQSPSANDFEKLGRKIESNTERYEENFSAIEIRLSELSNTIQQLAAIKQQQLPPRRLYVVRRSVPVRAGKSMNSESIGRVEIGDKVSIIRTDKKWIEFDYFDYTLGRASRGWAAKKYFDRLD
jgi:hypothetical protein